MGYQHSHLLPSATIFKGSKRLYGWYFKAVLKNFIADSVVFELDQYIKDKTVEFRKTYAIKLPDAIIAASAFTNDLTLISRNAKDFNKIEGLN